MFDEELIDTRSFFYEVRRPDPLVITQSTEVASRIILVHGYNQNSSSWSIVADRLVAKGHEVLLIDLFGFGKSGKWIIYDGHRPCVYIFARQIRSAVVKEGWHTGYVTIAGISMGGATTSMYLNKYGTNADGSTHVNKVILVAAAGRPEPHDRRLIVQLVNRQARFLSILYRLAGYRDCSMEIEAGLEKDFPSISTIQRGSKGFLGRYLDVNHLCPAVSRLSTSAANTAKLHCRTFPSEGEVETQDSSRLLRGDETPWSALSAPPSALSSPALLQSPLTESAPLPFFDPTKTLRIKPSNNPPKLPQSQEELVTPSNLPTIVVRKVQKLLLGLISAFMQLVRASPLGPLAVPANPEELRGYAWAQAPWRWPLLALRYMQCSNTSPLYRVPLETWDYDNLPSKLEKVTMIHGKLDTLHSHVGYQEALQRIAFRAGINEEVPWTPVAWRASEEDECKEYKLKDGKTLRLKLMANWFHADLCSWVHHLDLENEPIW